MGTTSPPPLPVQLATKLLPLLVEVVIAHAARINDPAHHLKTGLGEDLPSGSVAVPDEAIARRVASTT
ncbi:MAG: hypothetical protein ACHQQS_08510 [Thermoanaerobaculales bacterium]